MCFLTLNVYYSYKTMQRNTTSLKSSPRFIVLATSGHATVSWCQQYYVNSQSQCTLTGVIRRRLQHCTAADCSCIGIARIFAGGSVSARPTSFLQCFDTVGLVIWPVKIVPNMTYNVFGGTLNLALSIYLSGGSVRVHVIFSRHPSPYEIPPKLHARPLSTP